MYSCLQEYVCNMYCVMYTHIICIGCAVTYVFLQYICILVCKNTYAMCLGCVVTCVLHMYSWVPSYICVRVRSYTCITNALHMYSCMGIGCVGLHICIEYMNKYMYIYIIHMHPLCTRCIYTYMYLFIYSMRRI